MPTHTEYNHRCGQKRSQPAAPAIGFGELLFARLHLPMAVLGMLLRCIARRSGGRDKIGATGQIWRIGHLRRLGGKVHIYRQNAGQLPQGFIHPPRAGRAAHVTHRHH